MANQWFKFYGGEYLTDSKVGRLNGNERSAWLTLLCMASMDGGVIKYLSTEDLLMKSGIRFNPYDTTEWDDMQNVLKTFENYKMVKVREDGSVEILNWEKRQEHNMTVAERMAKSRAKKKEESADVTINVTNVTSEEKRIEENRIDISRTVAEATPKPKFQKPTIEEIKAYIKEKNYNVDANRFFNFYESKGWKVGKNPMVSWKASVATWQKDEPKTTPNRAVKEFKAEDTVLETEEERLQTLRRLKEIKNNVFKR